MPTFVIVLVLAMVSAYVVARSLPSSAEMSRVNVLQNTGRAVFRAGERAVQAASRRMAAGGADAGSGGGAAQPHSDACSDLLENFARRADLDSLIVTDANGQDVYGLAARQRRDVCAG